VGGFVDELLRHQRVGLDSTVFIYHVGPKNRWSTVAWTTMLLLAEGRVSGVTSILTLMEMAVKPVKLGHPAVADEYELLVRSIPQLEVVDIDAPAARAAAELRANHGLRAPDALHIGAAIVHGATAFITNDRRLRRVNETEIIILEDYV